MTSTDELHELKSYSDMPGQGRSEILERAAKSITPSLGLESTSVLLQRWARNFGHLLEYYGLAQIVRKKDVPWQEGLNKHMFILDDSVINALLVLGCGIAIIMNFDLLLPLAGIGVVYHGSDRFIKKIEKL